MSSRLAAVVMAAGLGTRMKSAVPKHLHALLGRRVVDWVLDAARDAGAEPLVVVASPDTRDAYVDHTVAVQERPLGTGLSCPSQVPGVACDAAWRSYGLCPCVRLTHNVA